jgi:nicotinamidase-related amidase
MLLELEDSQLVLIDPQERLLPALHEGMNMLQQAMRLGQAARLLRVPIWGTEHNPQGLGPMIGPLRSLCPMVLPKTTFSAVGAGLADFLRPPAKVRQGGNARSLPKHLQKPVEAPVGRNSIVLAGCETHVCLLQTALELIELEFDVWVVTDACSVAPNVTAMRPLTDWRGPGLSWSPLKWCCSSGCETVNTPSSKTS